MNCVHNACRLNKIGCASVAVKKGYHKKSLAVHPDRVGPEEKEEATKKFQTLGKVYALLSDKDKRAVYDESGEWGFFVLGCHEGPGDLWQL